MQIPHGMLAPETLNNLVEAFVTREGTDYGLRVYTLEEKVAQVVRQLELGEAVIVFDEVSESCNIIRTRS